MHTVRSGMIGNNRVLTEMHCQRIVEKRRRESRVDQFGPEVCSQFDHGMRLEWSQRGERVFGMNTSNENVMGLGVMEGTRLFRRFPLEIPTPNIVTLPLGAPVGAQSFSVKGKGKGKGKNWEEYEFDLPSLRESEASRTVPRERGLCFRCGVAGHEAYGAGSGMCAVRSSIMCLKCKRVGHHFNACSLLGFDLSRQLVAHPGYVNKFREDEGID
jgi:hypothetical protein